MTEPEKKRPAAKTPSVPTMEIVLYPDPFLNKKCRFVTPDEIKSGVAGKWNLGELFARMSATMYAAEGIGLAAPQVGEGLRLFVYDISPDRNEPQIVINPVLSKMRGTIVEEEGCLSIPRVRAKVKRSNELQLDGVDLKGEAVSIHADDLLGRVFQHETDHLDGVLFIKHLGMASRLMVRRALTELEEDYRELQQKKS